MKVSLQIAGLLVAFLFLPNLAGAQSPESKYAVSVRELSIPPKALDAFQQGVNFLAKKNASAGLWCFQRAVAEFSTYYEAYYKMGVANMHLQRPVEAEQAFRKAIDLSGGGFAQPLLVLGTLLNYEGKYAEAEKVVRQGVNLSPASWAGHYSLGWALFGLNRLDEAVESIRNVLRLKPDSAEARLLLADIHHRERDYAALLKDLDEYLKLDPNSLTSMRARSLREEAQQKLAETPSTSAFAEP